MFETLVEDSCQLIECSARIVNQSEARAVCGPECYYDLSQCGVGCGVGKAPNGSGICVNTDKVDVVYIGGGSGEDDVNCGQDSLSCSSIAYALNFRLNEDGSVVEAVVTGNSQLGGSVIMDYSVTLSGSGGSEIPIIFITNPSHNFVIDTSFSCKIESLQFSLDSISGLTNPFISTSGIPSGGNTGLSVNNVVLNYPFEMTSLSLIEITGSQFTFTNLGIYFTSSSINLEVGRKEQRNAGENICSSQRNYYPVFHIQSYSHGEISNSVFENSQTGALLIEDSMITILSTTFRNNIIRSLFSESFQYLRFNIFVRGGSLVVNNMITDTPGSFWIYNNDGTGIIDGDGSISTSPLFTPKVSGVSQGVVSDEGDSIVVYIIGDMLFPCDLTANFIINDDINTAQATGFEVVVTSDTRVSVYFPRELFSKSGRYSIFLTYGVGNLQKTSSFPFYSVSGSNDGGDGLSKGGSNLAAVAVLVVVVVVVVVVLVVIIVVFVLVYRRKQRLRGSGTGHGSKAGGGVFSEDLSRSKKYEKSFRGGFGEGDGEGGEEGEEVENFDENYEDDQEQGLLEDADEEDCYILLIFFFFYFFLVITP
jgi:hypothetical protein